jgi:alpha-glucosidase
LTPLPDGTKAHGTVPHQTPWRTIQLGTNPGDLVESPLLLNLNDPPSFNADWVSPGMYIGIWWALHIGKYTWTPGPNLGATTENTKEYIDFAADHDIPMLLVEGWNEGWDGEFADQDFTSPNPQYDLHDVVQYGTNRGVDLVAHCETGANFLAFEDQLEEAFSLYGDLDVSGVKTGYVGELPDEHHHHDQRLVNHHHHVISTAAKHGLLLDVHEGIKPTGLRRTYPNLLTTECVRGMEYNAWSEGNPPSHTVTLPFTRMLAGPLDFHQGSFRAVKPADFKPIYDAPLVIGTPVFLFFFFEVTLKILLPKAEPPSADAADALAIAITHAHHRQSAALRLKVVGL